MPLARLGGGWRDRVCPVGNADYGMRGDRPVGTVMMGCEAIVVETMPLARLGGGWREAG